MNKRIVWPVEDANQRILWLEGELAARKEQIEQLQEELAQSIAENLRLRPLAQWFEGRRCGCGIPFEHEGGGSCQLHRLVRAALGLGLLPCGHGRDAVRGSDEGTHWCGECEREDSADYETGRG